MFLAYPLHFVSADRIIGVAGPPLPSHFKWGTTPLILPSYSLPPTTTPTTISPDPYKELKNNLPWLRGVLRTNGTISSLPENLTLGLTETVTQQPECPKTPIDGTPGICTPLAQCPQVFPLLTSEELFRDYFCPLEDRFIGVCCPEQKPAPVP